VALISWARRLQALVLRLPAPWLVLQQASQAQTAKQAGSSGNQRRLTAREPQRWVLRCSPRLAESQPRTPLQASLRPFERPLPLAAELGGIEASSRPHTSHKQWLLAAFAGG